MTEFENVHLLDHPLIQHKLTLLRDKNTPSLLFRSLIKEISMLMGYEITRDLPLKSKQVETPTTTMESPLIAGRKIAVISMLRAGLGMSEGLLELIPAAKEGHLGVFRDPKTGRFDTSMIKIPDSTEGRVIVVTDPIIATGQTISYAIDVLNNHGVNDDRIRLMSIIATPGGLTTLNRRHPNVHVFIAGMDQELDENNHVIPGLGSAGNRMFGTE